MTPLWREIFDKTVEEVQEEQQRLAEAMIAGKFETFEQYKFYAGQFQGLKFALERMQEVANRTINEKR